jgi:hypothetical protein
MVVLPCTGALRYHNCCIDGGTSPEYFGYTLVLIGDHVIWQILVAECVLYTQCIEENRILKRVLYRNLETIRPRGRPRNRWQNEVRVDGRIVGREAWQEKL